MQLPVLAAAVDPRFKQLKFLKSEQIATVKAEQETRMLLGYSSDGRERAPDATKKHKSDQTTAFDILLGPDDDSERELTAGEELERYFAERTVSRQTKPRMWWKDNAKRFPRLAVIAQSLLCIPATSTPSERIFSKAGLTVSKLLTSLKPSNVDALIFLNKNFKCAHILFCIRVVYMYSVCKPCKVALLNILHGIYICKVISLDQGKPKRLNSSNILEPKVPTVASNLCPSTNNLGRDPSTNNLGREESIECVKWPMQDVFRKSYIRNSNIDQSECAIQ